MKILIIRFSSIGDIVLTTPVVRCVKQQLPQAEVHFLTKKGFAPILEANPYITQTHYLQDSLAQTAKALKPIGFDYVIDLHNNQRSFLLRKLLGAPSSVFYKANVKKWLMVNLKVNRLPNVHIVDRYMATLAKLGVVDDGAGLDYFILPTQEVDMATLPATHKNGYVALVLGAKHATKQYPADLMAQLAKKLPYPIVLLGGPEDQANAETIIAASGNPLVYNGCGRYSLNGSASLVRQAKVVVSNDTGLMHIAAAFQRTIVSLWGNTIPQFGMYPYYGGNSGIQPVILETEGLPCRPCSKIGYPACPQGHFKCMRLIQPQAIAAEVQKLW